MTLVNNNNNVKQFIISFKCFILCFIAYYKIINKIYNFIRYDKRLLLSNNIIYHYLARCKFVICCQVTNIS